MTGIDSLALVLTVVGVVLALPAGLVLVQTIAAALSSAPGTSIVPRRAATRAAVLVPAHDEGRGIGATLRTLRAQLAPEDRLLVVADNCSDDTAQAAALGGAEVVERFDPTRRGKGYALDFGIRHLEAAPPDVVVVVDADCELHPGSLDLLVWTCAREMRPVQALDLMRAPPGAPLKSRIAEFAWLFKNHVRPLGFLRLGLPCQLMGTGMAFPWELIRAAPLASGHIVEDLRLGIDLASAGAPALFCPGALVTSVFPADEQGVADQRARWEGGHVSVILREAPRALWRALTRGRPALAALAIDVCVPPLTMLMLLLVAQAIVDGAVFAAGGPRAPFWLALAGLTMLVLAVSLAWLRFGRSVLTLADLRGAPLYVLGKLPLYARLLRRGKHEWVRARRDRHGE